MKINLGDPEQAIIVEHPRAAQSALHERYPRSEQDRAGRGAPIAAARREPNGLMRQPHRRHSEVAADSQQHREQGRMQMEMLVYIDVIKREAGARERRELSMDFRFELSPQSGEYEEAHAVDEHAVIHAAGRIRKTRNEIRGQHCAAFREDEMQAYP